MQFSIREDQRVEVCRPNLKTDISCFPAKYGVALRRPIFGVAKTGFGTCRQKLKSGQIQRHSKVRVVQKVCFPATIFACISSTKVLNRERCALASPSLVYFPRLLLQRCLSKEQTALQPFHRNPKTRSLPTSETVSSRHDISSTRVHPHIPSH